MVNIEKNLQRKNKDDWFFGMWQPRQIHVNGKLTPFEQVDADFLADHQDPWVMSSENNWHGLMRWRKPLHAGSHQTDLYHPGNR